MRANNTKKEAQPARYTGQEFRADRERLGLSQAELGILLQTPKRTLQDWESGDNRIPGIALVAMTMLLTKDRQIMADIKERIQQRAQREFPNGIISEVEEM